MNDSTKTESRSWLGKLMPKLKKQGPRKKIFVAIGSPTGGFRYTRFGNSPQSDKRSDVKDAQDSFSTASNSSGAAPMDFIEWTVDGRTGLYGGNMTKDRVPHGRGTIVFTNGDKYEGPFKDGNMHGLDAVFTRSDGRGKYKGEFQNNKRHGHGEYKTKSRFYVGQFESGKRHGEGSQYYLDGSIDFDGRWIRGEPEIDIDTNEPELRKIFSELFEEGEETTSSTEYYDGVIESLRQ